MRRQGADENVEENPAQEVDSINDAKDLPEEEPIKPGHTLLRPSEGMLKSAAKYPQDLNKLVYGNLQNLGMMYGDTHERLKYTGFRKSDGALDSMLKSISLNNRNPTVFFIEPQPKRERLDIMDFPGPDFYNFPNFRRSKTNYRNREKYYIGASSENDDERDSKEYERNPGNPYTVHKNRYKVNFMWNHVMTGDHMNLNPYGPQGHSMGPSGADLLFNRKWWYFNQDDYMPF